MFIVSSSSLSSSSEEDDANALTNGTDALLWLFIGLGLGLLTMQAVNKSNSFMNFIPYTVIVFIYGIFFALYLNASQHTDYNTMDIGLESWLHLNPNLMLFIFLPPLIFSEAIRQNMFFFNKALPQSFLLAFPGVILNALLLAGFAKLIVPSWEFNLCCLFGSILSATDTVSVVSILHSAAASPKLTIIIVGESLGNDGTSLMLFELFLMIVLSQNQVEAPDVALLVVRALLLSPILGMIAGFITYFWLRSLKKAMKETDVLIQIGITLCSSYLTFYIAQYTCEASGVMAVAVSGLVVASLSGPVILNKESMDNIWEYIEWIGNTLIFLLAGLITGHKVLKTIYGLDWLILVGLYLVSNVCRLLTVVFLWPLLKRWGYGMTKNEASFLSFAGLRGALSLALAVDVTDHISTPETSQLFFFVGGIVTLSLLVNGSLCRAVLEYLNLKNENSIENTVIIDNLKKRISRKMKKVIEDTCKEYQLSEDDSLSVKSRCSILRVIDQPINTDIGNITITNNERNESTESTNIINKAIKGISFSSTVPSESDNRSSFTASSIQSIEKFKSLLPYTSKTRVRKRVERINEFSRLLSRAERVNTAMVPKVLQYVRTIFLEIVRTNYWKSIETGKLHRTSYAVQFLLYSIDLGLDEISKGANNWYSGLKDFDYINTEISQVPKYLGFLRWLTETTKSSYIHSIYSRFEARRMKRNVVILQSFIEAHTYAAKTIHSFIEDDESNDTASAYLPEEVRVKDESLRQVELATKLLHTYIDPQTILLVKTTQATLSSLAKEHEIITNMIKEGLITNSMAEFFFAEIDEDKKKMILELSILYKKRHPLLESNNDTNNTVQELLLG